MMNIQLGSEVMVKVQGGALVLGEVTGINGDDVFVYIFIFGIERTYTLSQLQDWNKVK